MEAIKCRNNDFRTDKMAGMMEKRSWGSLVFFSVRKNYKILKKCVEKCFIFTKNFHESDRIWGRRTSLAVGDPEINFIRPNKGFFVELETQNKSLLFPFSAPPETLLFLWRGNIL